MTHLLTEVAEAIAHWDYVTATHEEPDSNESLIMPPHIEIATRVLDIVFRAVPEPTDEPD